MAEPVTAGYRSTKERPWERGGLGARRKHKPAQPHPPSPAGRGVPLGSPGALNGAACFVCSRVIYAHFHIRVCLTADTPPSPAPPRSARQPASAPDGPSVQQAAPADARGKRKGLLGAPRRCPASP